MSERSAHDLPTPLRIVPGSTDVTGERGRRAGARDDDDSQTLFLAAEEGAGRE